jgi:predicted naringenin-chalcone synthase
MKAAPIIVRTATAVPGHSGTQEEVKARLRALLPLPARKLDAVMEMFDHTAVERRFSVEPLSELGTPRGLGEVQRLYRDNAIVLGKKVAAEALAGAGHLRARKEGGRRGARRRRRRSA